MLYEIVGLSILSDFSQFKNCIYVFVLNSPNLENWFFCFGLFIYLKCMITEILLLRELSSGF